MDNPEIPIQGAASGSEDFWSRSLDHTRTFDDQPHRGRAIVDDMRDHGRHSHAQDSGRESGRGLSRGHGSGYYREYDRDRSRHDSDRAGTNDNRYRDRDYYPRKYREREHDSYRDSYRDGVCIGSILS